MIPRYSRAGDGRALDGGGQAGALAGGGARGLPRVGRARGDPRGRPRRDRGAGPGFSVERTQELERTTNHDVVAFLTDVNERVGPASRWIHYGMTSSDVLDTGPRPRDPALGRAAAGRAGRAHRDPARPGPAPRGHALRGAHPRHPRRAHDLRAEARRPRPGEPAQRGAPGRRDPRAPRWESCPAPSAPTRCSTRRSRRGCWPSSASPASRWPPRSSPATATRSSCARWPSPPARSTAWPPSCATSSAPSCARPRRRSRPARRAARRCPTSATRSRRSASRASPGSCAGYAVAALEDVALWHERDISHSSVERIILPDAFLALDYMLARTRTLMEGLVVRPGPHAGGARVVARARVLAAGAARAGGAGPDPRGGLRAGAAQRDARLGRGAPAGRAARRRPGGRRP